MGKKKIIIDTNNLISALGWEGPSKELFRQVIEKEHELFISVKQLTEIRRVIDYPKLGFTNDQKARFLEIISSVATIVETKTNLDIIKEDPDDNFLLECASEVNADYIISGDGHMKKLGQFRNTKIIKVSDFLKETSHSDFHF
jgi:putative PIN family toxin of toxin-antitoxin system